MARLDNELLGAEDKQTTSATSASATQSAYTLRVSARKLTGTLVAIVATLLAIHILLQICHYQWYEIPWLIRQFFDVDEEDSLPTWYSAVALLLAAGLLYVIARCKRIEGDAWTWYWYGLCAAFVFLSMDEIAGLHESFNTVTDFSWTIPGAVGAALFGLAYIRFLQVLPSQTRWLFVVSACMFIAGAVGVERSTDWYEDSDLLDTLAYNLWNALEEGLEMGGVVLFIYALLIYMSRSGSVAIEVLED